MCQLLQLCGTSSLCISGILSTSIRNMAQTIFVTVFTAQAQAVSSVLLPSISPACSSSGGLNSSRSIRNMILDTIYDTQNFGKGWWGYNIMPRAPAAVFVELMVTASLVMALVLTPLTQRVVQKLWRQREVTWHAPMFVGNAQSCNLSRYHAIF